MLTRFLESKEVARVAEALQGHSRAIWLLMNATGIRISDAVKIRENDIDRNGVLMWVSSKTGKTASRILPGEVLAVLPLPKVRTEAYLFKSAKNPSKHIHRSTVFRHIKQACNKVGIDPEGVGTHSARKSFAVRDFRENGLGKTMFDLQHSSAATTLLYALSDNPIPRIFQKLKELEEELIDLRECVDIIFEMHFDFDEPAPFTISDEKNGV